MFTLFSLQEECVSYLENVEAALIGDDMGLGKTVEGLERDRRLRLKKLKLFKYRTLIVAPLGPIMDSWVEHIEQHFPGKVICRIDPKDREGFVQNAIKGESDFYIVHWQGLAKLPGLIRVRWFHIIADEIHRAGNRKSQQTQALKKLTCFYKTGLSGTAAQDKPEQLWSVLNWLYPKQYKAFWKFYNYYVDYDLQYAKGREVRKILGTKNEKELLKDIKPFYVRRLKRDVLKELPEKYYTTYWVDLDPRQRRAYDEMRKNMLTWVGEHEDQPVMAPVVISQLVRLQQFACAYGEIESYYVRVKDLETGQYKRNPDKSFVLQKRKRLVLADPSSKLDFVMSLLDQTDEQIGVFSQSKQVVNLLGKRLEEADITWAPLTGDVAEADRVLAVEKFQAKKIQVIAATIQTGGEGITLTSGSTVVFVDRTWTPSKNEQAEDRFHRIGQTRGVQIIDIMARNTVDLGRMQRIETKWYNLKKILGDDVSNFQMRFSKGLEA